MQLEMQVALFNEVFRQKFTIDNWKDKHYKNPYAGCSENIGLFDESNLVAFNMFMPQEYFINGEKYLMLQSCESVVKEAYRGNGYLKEILEGAGTLLKDRFPVIYGIPNEKSKPTFDKLGYKTKFKIDMMIMVGRKRTFILKSFQRLFRISFETKKKCLDLDKLLFKTYDEMEGKVTVSSDFPLERSWNFGRGNICVNRTGVFYNWKINNNTCSGKIKRCLYIEEEGMVKAYCIVSFAITGASCNAEIIDCFAQNGEIDNFNAIMKGLKKICSVITILVPESGKLNDFIKQIGFHIYKKGIASLVYKVIDDSAVELKNALETENNWDFLMIEADTVLN